MGRPGPYHRWVGAPLVSPPGDKKVKISAKEGLGTWSSRGRPWNAMIEKGDRGFRGPSRAGSASPGPLAVAVEA